MQTNEITNTAIVLIYSDILEYFIFKELHRIGYICPCRGHHIPEKNKATRRKISQVAFLIFPHHFANNPKNPLFDKTFVED